MYNIVLIAYGRYNKLIIMDHFGEHLMIDGYGGDFERLNDRKLVFKCLDELPKRIDMKKFAEPSVYWAKPNGKKDPGGWTGFVVIQESHISIHTFPKRGFLSADVYTCKNGLDVDFVLTYFKKLFSLQEVERNFIQRGVKYPKESIYA